MNILDSIVIRAEERAAEKKKAVPLEIMKRRASDIPCRQGYPFEKALKGKEMAFICEIKRASPSAGMISPENDGLRTASEYHKAGAAALSVLTEPYFFNGSDDDLREITASVPLPVLRKDFITDEYMIYEAKALGASAVLLICRILDERTLAHMISVAHDIGLSVLAETHNAYEIEKAADAGARVIGINNRNLGTFETDLSVSERLRPLIPDDVIFVAESGIRTPEDAERMRRIGADAVLVGEALMRSPDRTAELRRLRGCPHD